MEKVRLHDREFGMFIAGNEISARVKEMADAISADMQNEKPLFIVVLNGAFVFASDLLRKLNFECEVTFIRLTSYQGTTSTGEVRVVLGLDENPEGRNVVIIEDIIDTGVTLSALLDLLKDKKAASVKVASLLFKPGAYQGSRTPDYTGIEVPNDFLVGYGLDYDGLGRNLDGIYRLIDN